LLGHKVFLTEKRDGENVSVWLNENDEPVISSRRLIKASKDITERMIRTPEYEKAIDLVRSEKEYGREVIVYGELLKPISPTRIEPRKKHIHWILFDIFDVQAQRFYPYQLTAQRGNEFWIPTVRLVDYFQPFSMEYLEERIEKALKWCRRHHREGIVGKKYHGEQIFFKEKITLPKLPKLPRKTPRVQLPPMPEDKIIRALQHAIDEVGIENWSNKAIAMPVVARHITTEAREHNFAVPKNIYMWYVTTPIEKLRSD